MTPIILLLIFLCGAPAAAQEPRLPSPVPFTLDSSSIEAAIAQAHTADAWRRVGEREPLLLSYSQAQAIRASLAAGDLPGALDGIAKLTVPVPTDILLRIADAFRTAGQLYRAQSFYRQARASAGRTSAADTAALGLAATLEQAGDLGAALEVLRELELTFRQAAAFDAAEAGVERLAPKVNGAEPLSEQDYDLIADRLTSLAAFRRSNDVLNRWRTAYPQSARMAQIDYEILQNLYSLRVNDEARAQAQQIIQVSGEGTDSAAATRTLVSLDVREGKTADVERRGFALLRGEVPGTTLEQRLSVGRQLGEYLLGIGQAGRAIPVFEQVSTLTNSRTERLDMMWRIAVASLRAGNRTRAITQLRQVRRLTLDSETDRATEFWLGYALNAAGQRAEAQKLWSDLIERYPFSFYGTQTASRLGTAAPTPAALVFPVLALSDTVMAQPDYRIAALLSRAGLLTDAAFYARRLNATLRRDNAVALLAARASEAAGEPSATATIISSFFGDYLERPATGLPSDFWQLAYPRAYWEQVSDAAARHHVDPLLMIALSRQESHFERTIKSPVGAIGLFQIMPYTAVELDPSFPVQRADEELVKPDVAAELAARLLERNIARFDGALAPAVAAYNADIERVQTWWDAAKGLPEELFVDSIPYLQTRAYVRQVLANYRMYQRTAAPASSPQK